MFNLPGTWWEMRRESVREIPGFLSASSVVYYTSFPLGKAIAFCPRFVSYLDFVWRKENLETVPLPKYLWARMGFNTHCCLVRYHIPIRSKSWVFSQFGTTLNGIKMVSLSHMVYKVIKSLKVPAHKGNSEFSNNKNTSDFFNLHITVRCFIRIFLWHHFCLSWLFLH